MLLTVTLLNVIVQQAINTWDIPPSHIFEILMNLVTILSFFFLIFFEVILFFFYKMWVICPVSSAFSLFGQRSQRKALGKLSVGRRSVRFLLWGPDASLGSS